MYLIRNTDKGFYCIIKYKGRIEEQDSWWVDAWTDNPHEATVIPFKLVLNDNHELVPFLVAMMEWNKANRNKE